MKPHLKGDLRNSLYDGVMAHIFATLTGGVFLTGFALYLGMDDLMIGLLAAMPFSVTIFQLPVSHHIGRSGRTKRLAFVWALAARGTWLFVLAAVLFPGPSLRTKAFLFLGLIFLSYAFASISYVSWLSWMSDLITDEIRGRFFGTRNMVCGAAGVLVTVVFGNLLDRLNDRSFEGVPLGFVTVFLFAVLCGIAGLHFLNRISEPPAQAVEHGSPGSFRTLTGIPFKEPNFRRFLAFSFLWNFSVYFASPFFTLYFLRELKYSYSFVAALSLASAFADIMGMHYWGRISDRVKNKVVIQVAGWSAVFLPLGWVLVDPGSLILPIVLHLIGGGFWAGINLCTSNLLLRISPRQHKPFFFSTYHMVAGIGAGSAPIVAGLVLHLLENREVPFFSRGLVPIEAIFLVSTVLRALSLQILRWVTEPEQTTVGQVIRILRSVRGLNLASGFNALMHPFVEIENTRKKTE